MIPVTNFLVGNIMSSPRDYLQRTNKELCPTGKGQSPEAQYQQYQGVCRGLPKEQEATCPGCQGEEVNKEESYESNQ